MIVTQQEIDSLGYYITTITSKQVIVADNNAILCRGQEEQWHDRLVVCHELEKPM